MHQQFQNWCRLCAKDEGCSKDLLAHGDASPDVRLAIERHFCLKIQLNDEAPTTICDDCYECLLKLIEFEEIVLRSQSVFQCVSSSNSTNEEEFEIPPVYVLDEIKEVHDPLEEAGANCLPTTQCEQKFKAGNDRVGDKDSHSSTAKLSCDICGGIFKTLFSLRNHQKLVHSNIRPFVCDECGKAFKRSGDLTRHKEFHRDDTPFACKICQKKFSSKLVVKMHEKIHNEDNYMCNICGKELKTMHTLRGHMQTHSNEMHFKCKYCDKRFRYKKNLSCHLLTHTGLQPFSCAFCNKAFSLRWNCTTHLRKFHPSELAQDATGAIITNIAKQKFACGRRQTRDSAEVEDH